MKENTEIRCPKCNSNQLTANKKGFSGAKAVGGAILTGGFGLLAGTLGSNKVIITCLACGYRFKPGQGRLDVEVKIQGSQLTDSTQQTAPNNIVDTIDQRILEITQQKGKLAAIKFCKDAKGWDLSVAKNYVDDLAAANGISGKKEGCFIATACYGDYNSYEVLILRDFRDTVLKKNYFGRAFIKIYYFISPTIANVISNSVKTKSFIRRYILGPIVSSILISKS